jgi:hypothetical protein
MLKCCKSNIISVTEPTKWNNLKNNFNREAEELCKVLVRKCELLTGGFIEHTEFPAKRQQISNTILIKKLLLPAVLCNDQHC